MWTIITYKWVESIELGSPSLDVSWFSGNLSFTCKTHIIEHGNLFGMQFLSDCHSFIEFLATETNF